MTAPEALKTCEVPVRRICLVGLRGSGKSSVARAVSALLGWPLVDTDAELTRLHGPIAEQFARDGEMEFRQRERAVLAGCLAAAPVVVSTGGGAVLLEANRSLLREAHTVWLQAGPAELAKRIIADPATADQRPALLPGAPDADPHQRWSNEMERLLELRAPLYAEVARQVIDTAKVSPLAAAAGIVRAVNGGRQPENGDTP
jgi:shikimate kinase